jgi:macrolide transport system ATP-binding/permease protein
MTGRPLLALVGVSKIYGSGQGGLKALDEVSLDVHEGEFVAIVGQSGSGKSTLMQIIGCLDRPTSGSYHISGREVAGLDADALAALRRDTFGFVFQRYNLLATATAAENVEIPAIYAGRPHAERLARAHELLARLGLGDRAGHRPSQLSGGQQQRVSIARALMNDAPVILADEPTGALDSQSGLEVMDLLVKLNAEGRTVLLITHNPELAQRAGRVVRMRDGRIVDDAPTTAPARPRPADSAQPRQAHGASLVPDLAEAVKMALRSLRANLFRTALTLLGVVIGVAAVVTMLAVGDGSKADVLARIQAMGTNLLMVIPGAPGMRPTGDIATMVPGDATAIAEVANVEAVAPERGMAVTVRAGNIDYQTQVQGVWSGFPKVRDWATERGSFIAESDVLSYAPVVVIGQTVAKNLFPDVKNPLGQYILISNIPFEIIGVMAAKGASAMGEDQDDALFVPLSTGFMRLFGKQQYLNGIMVRVADVSKVDATQAAIRQLLLSRHRTEDFQIRSTSSLLEAVTATQNTLTILLGSVAAISLLVGGIGVMNIMLVSVTERTREIGIRMATGARMQNILLQFNTEALVVCGIGGIIGVGLGLGAAAAIGTFGGKVAFSPWPPLLAFSCAFATGLVFGYLPARKAARLDPVVALASE